MKVLESLIDELRACCASFPDKRTGRNCRYAMADIGLAAFSIFFMQSPSFLARQRALESARGRSNCRGLFGIGKIPIDNHIRDMLDPAAPDALFGLFTRTVAALEDGAALAAFRRLVPDHPQNGRKGRRTGRPSAGGARRHGILPFDQAPLSELLAAQAPG